MDPSPQAKDKDLQSIIQRVKRNDATLTSLDEDSLGEESDSWGIRFRAEHAPALADALSSNTAVTRLAGDAFYSWEDLKMFLSVAAKTDALRDNTTLKELDLSYCDGRVPGDAGVAAIKDIIAHNSSLEELDLGHLGMTDEEAEIIVAAMQCNHTVKVLDLCKNDVGDRAVLALSDVLRGSNKSLEKLRLSWCGIGHSGAAAIGEGLAQNNSLKYLELYGNRDIGDSGVIALAHGLKNNKALEKLTLGGCSIGDRGAAAMGEALSQINGLKELRLHGDGNIGESGVIELANGLKKNNTLCVLRLAGCSMARDGYKAFVECLGHNDKLQQLTLVASSGTFVDRKSASTFANILKFHNHSLKQLILRFRSNDQDVENMVQSYTKINRDSNSSLEAYARKTHLFPRSHLGGLTKKSTALPSALQCLDGIGSLSVIYCFVREMHVALLGCRTAAGKKEKKRKREDLLS